MERNTLWDDPQLSDGDMGYTEKKLTTEPIMALMGW